MKEDRPYIEYGRPRRDTEYETRLRADLAYHQRKQQEETGLDAERRKLHIAFLAAALREKE